MISYLLFNNIIVNIGVFTGGAGWALPPSPHRQTVPPKKSCQDKNKSRGVYPAGCSTYRFD